MLKVTRYPTYAANDPNRNPVFVVASAEDATALEEAIEAGYPHDDEMWYGQSSSYAVVEVEESSLVHETARISIGHELLEWLRKYGKLDLPTLLK
jgi:hypothetical protein